MVYWKAAQGIDETDERKDPEHSRGGYNVSFTKVHLSRSGKRVWLPLCPAMAIEIDVVALSMNFRNVRQRIPASPCRLQAV